MFLLAAALAVAVTGSDEACRSVSGGFGLCPDVLIGIASEPALLSGGGQGSTGSGGGGSASLLQTSVTAVAGTEGSQPRNVTSGEPRNVTDGGRLPKARPTHFVENFLRQPTRHLVHPSSIEPGQLYAEHTESEVHNLARFGVLPVSAVTMTAFLLGSTISSWKYTSFIPETLCTVGVSVLLGAIIRHMIHYGLISDNSFVLVDATILSLFLMPIIIFEGGWFVSLPHFRRQFPYIMIFAIWGTLLSIMIIGCLSTTLGNWGFHPITDLRANFAFASLISATDPVATLATFTQLKIAERQPMLNSLVFGESMINDAVAIVMFNAVNFSASGQQKGLLLSIFWLFSGSMLLGGVAAAALVLPLRFARLPGKSLPEVFYIFLTPYLIYALAETFDLSGIIACLFAGIVFRLYGAQHLTEEGLHKVDNFLETMGRFADSGVFILCGCSTALIDVGCLGYCLCGLILCLFSRAVMVQVCGALSNRLKTFRHQQQEEMISWKHKFMIWLSGLRGGIGLMLALEIDEKWCGSLNKERIINTTFFLVCTLLFFCGSMTEPCLKMLGLVRNKSGELQSAGPTPPPSDLASNASNGSSSNGVEDFHENVQVGAAAMAGDSASGNWLHNFLQCALVGEGRQGVL